MGKADNISVIVSTYNAPERLMLVLHALARQTILPAEVVVADDGSTDDTVRELRATAARMPFSITHAWQPDEGFRAARARNNAIHNISGDILAMLDQDTLPHHNWLHEHVKVIARGHVCVGSMLELSEAGSQPSVDTVRDGSFERMHEPEAKAVIAKRSRRFKLYAVLRNIGLGVKNKPSIRACNTAVYRDDVVRVNGFDEEYVGWGQEDDDLSRRLYMAGVKPIPVVHSALVSHMPHDSRRDVDWKAGPNVERYHRKITDYRCAVGLKSHPHPDVKVTTFDTP